MAITVTILSTKFVPSLDTTQSTQLVRGTLAFTGSYTTGGDTINFATHAIGVGNPIASSNRPIGMQFWEEPASGTPVSGLAGMLWYRNVNAKPNATNGVIQIVGGATIPAGVFTIGTEAASGAYNAAILAAKIYFEAIFTLGV